MNFFMNKFKKLGYIKCNGSLTGHDNGDPRVSFREKETR